MAEPFVLCVTVTVFEDVVRVATSAGVVGAMGEIRSEVASAEVWARIGRWATRADVVKVGVVDRRPGVLAFTSGCGRMLTAARPSWVAPEPEPLYRDADSDGFDYRDIREPEA